MRALSDLNAHGSVTKSLNIKRFPIVGRSRLNLCEPPLSSLLTNYVKSGRALDIGCGRGLYTELLLRKGYLVAGIDINQPRLKQASKFADTFLSDSSQLPFKERVFNLVCILQVLHHIATPEKTLDEISRVLKDGGLLYLTEVVDDNPLFKLLRNIRPSWEGDPVKTRLTRGKLRQMLSKRFLVIREDMSNGNFHWMWWILATRVIDAQKVERAIITKLMRFAERQLDKVFKNRFSCTYHAILRVC